MSEPGEPANRRGAGELAGQVLGILHAAGEPLSPAEVRERLGIRPGDRLRYVFDAEGVRIEKEAPREEEDPFVAFSEWSSEADEAAYGDL